MGTPALHRPASPPRGDARLRPASRPASRHAWVLVAALLATACASEVQAAGQREPPAPASPAAAPAASAVASPAAAPVASPRMMPSETPWQHVTTTHPVHRTLAGSEGWRTREEVPRVIEGYTTVASGPPGTVVGLKVSTTRSRFRVLAFRI